MSDSPAFNIADFALQHALGPRAEHPALVVTNANGARVSVSHRALREGALRIAGGLRAAGVQAGERVLVRLPTGPNFAFAALGVWAAGAVLVPTSELLTPAEAAFIAQDSGARALVTEPSLPSLLPYLERDTPPAESSERAELVELQVHALLAASAAPAPASTRASDPALLVYTSGTTSRPKGVLHAQRMALGRAPMREGWTGISEGDVVLHAGKLNWTYTLGIALIDAPAAGATTVLYADAPTPEIWPRLIASEAATIFAAVPSIYRQILKYCDNLENDTRSLTHGLTAGEPLPLAVAQGWAERVGKPLYEALGMSECSTYVSTGPNTPARAGSPGKPQPGRRIAILPIENDAHGTTPLGTNQIGLLAIHRSDPGLMLGYWKRPSEEAEVLRGEWFVGGDLARIDDEGYVWFEGRSNDLMNAFGYRVSPLEVEAEIGPLEGIAEYAVAEREVAPDVRVVCLYAVPAQAPPSAEALLEACAARLASYKRPRAVVFCDALPRGRNGKLQRRALAELPDTNA